MNYERMWNDLKTHVQEDLRFYRDGKECSPIEAPMGVMHTSNFLRKMEEMEKSLDYKNESEKSSTPRCRHCHSEKTAFIHTDDASLAVHHFDDERLPEHQTLRLHVQLCACMNCGAVFIAQNDLNAIKRAVSNPTLYPKQD